MEDGNCHEGIASFSYHLLVHSKGYPTEDHETNENKHLEINFNLLRFVM